MIKYILAWLLIFIIGSLIVNVIINPQFRSETINKFQDIVEIQDITERINSVVENTPTSSISCEEDFNERYRKAKIKNKGLDYKIIEKKSFIELEGAKSYVRDWEADNSRNTISFLNENFNNSEKIDIVLISLYGSRCFFSTCWNDVTELKFGVCDKEEIIYP